MITILILKRLSPAVLGKKKNDFRWNMRYNRVLRVPVYNMLRDHAFFPVNEHKTFV